MLTFVQYVPQDTAKLIELQGGDEKFIDRLNFIFDDASRSIVTIGRLILTARILALFRFDGRTLATDSFHVPLRKSSWSQHAGIEADHRTVLQHLRKRSTGKRW